MEEFEKVIVGRDIKVGGCECAEDESCDMCEVPDEDVCTVNEMVDFCKEHSPFDGLTTKLTLVKAADYTAAVESYYAPVGNKPMELLAPKASEPKDDDLEEAAQTFFDYIEQYLNANQVKITELPEAFNFDAMADMADSLKTVAKNQLQEEIQDGLNQAESKLERLFGQVNLMSEYLKVLKDTEDSIIGVLWCDNSAFVNMLDTSRSKIKRTRQSRPTAERIDPCYFWATPDWTEHREGRALFRLVEKTNGDLEAMKDSVSDKLKANITKLLEEDAYRINAGHLFIDDLEMFDNNYDVLVCRGYFQKKVLEKAGIKVKSDERMVPAEVWYSKNMVIYGEQLPDYIERLGVYTTYFRNQGSSIWGISLHDFIESFARMYEGVIKRIDKSAAKSVGSLVMVDTSVAEDWDKHLEKDDDGNPIINFSNDTLIEFDSSEAGLSPNFKGVPIHVEKLPHDLDKLLPILNMIFQQIEIITGIPSILSTGNPDSSAVRTDGSYRTAFRAANGKIASIIRRSRDSVLLPAIKFFYHGMINDGMLKDFPIEAYPEVLFDKRLELEVSNARNMAGILTDLGPYAQVLPPETVSGILNNMGRELYGLDYDIVPGQNPVGSGSPAQLTEAA